MNGETMTIEEERMMQLEQDQIADEASAEKEEESETGSKTKPAEEHYINAGEAILLLAFTGFIELLQWALDLIPYVGWVVNIIISFFVGGIIFLWLTGKIAKGAPKKWLKAVYYGAAGGALPIIPGYLGVIIYLLIQDRKILGKTAGKIMEKI